VCAEALSLSSLIVGTEVATVWVVEAPRGGVPATLEAQGHMVAVSLIDEEIRPSSSGTDQTMGESPVQCVLDTQELVRHILTGFLTVPEQLLRARITCR
jgi:hypothetical protein